VCFGKEARNRLKIREIGFNFLRRVKNIVQVVENKRSAKSGSCRIESNGNSTRAGSICNSNRFEIVRRKDIRKWLDTH
jgi:hypothetical protein